MTTPLGAWHKVRTEPSELHEHLPFLAGLGHGKTVVEFGFQVGKSATAFLVGGCNLLVSYDIDPCEHHQWVAQKFPRRFLFVQQSSCEADVVSCDVLFIDSSHEEEQTYTELSRHHVGVRDCIVLHDTEGAKSVGVRAALERFLTEHPRWRTVLHLPYNNGLTVLRWL